jgi:hypothetical protein
MFNVIVLLGIVAILFLIGFIMYLQFYKNNIKKVVTNTKKEDKKKFSIYNDEYNRFYWSNNEIIN